MSNGDTRPEDDRARESDGLLRPTTPGGSYLLIGLVLLFFAWLLTPPLALIQLILWIGGLIMVTVGAAAKGTQLTQRQATGADARRPAGQEPDGSP